MKPILFTLLFSAFVTICAFIAPKTQPTITHFISYAIPNGLGDCTISDGKPIYGKSEVDHIRQIIALQKGVLPEQVVIINIDRLPIK